MHLYRLGELNLVLLNRYSLIRVPTNESQLLHLEWFRYSQWSLIMTPVNQKWIHDNIYNYFSIICIFIKTEWNTVRSAYCQQFFVCLINIKIYYY